MRQRKKNIKEGRTKVTNPWHFTTVWRRSLLTDLNQFDVFVGLTNKITYTKHDFKNSNDFSRPTGGKRMFPYKKPTASITLPCAIPRWLVIESTSTSHRPIYSVRSSAAASTVKPSRERSDYREQVRRESLLLQLLQPAYEDDVVARPRQSKPQFECHQWHRTPVMQRLLRVTRLAAATAAAEDDD